MTKILVAYFSHTGENYSNGSIVELKKGNTHVVAEMIQNICGSDIFEIKAKNDYPFEYRSCTEVAKEELNNNERPDLVEDIDVSSYDVIFVGYPNWWGTMPMTVWTFLENHDFSNKTILPFCTHEGSQMGNSVNDLKRLVKNAIIKKGLPIHGSSTKNAKAKVEQWIKQELK